VVWAWFLMPAGAPVLTWSAFVGIAFLVSMHSVWTEKITKGDLEVKDAFAHVITVVFLKIATVLLLLGTAGIVYALVF
jgi:hypothetical protein